MGSTILNGAEIGEYTIIGAGSLVTQGKKIPPGVLCMGVPAKVIRDLHKGRKRKPKRISRALCKVINEVYSKINLI